MKAKLEFDLDDFDERLKHSQCIYSDKAFQALSNIIEMLRQRVKCKEPISDAHYEECESISSQVHTIINQCHLPLKHLSNF